MASIATARQCAGCYTPACVQETVGLCQNYRHALWSMAFVGVYMVVLYLQVRQRAHASMHAVRGGMYICAPAHALASMHVHVHAHDM